MKRILSIVLCVAIVLSFAAVALTAQAATTGIDSTGLKDLTSPSDFSWDNASVYFLLTDRFKNGNTSNDHSYGRGLNQSGQPVKGNSDAAMFHGGDFAGVTQAINDGYFNNLGVNALWISAPYEQSHGWVAAGSGKSGTFAHYSYHGYYVLDYTETDKNFGTEEEFKTLVETAHKHGLRIVMDIVMNHAGYCTLQDMKEFNYGAFRQSGWEKQYYDHTMESSAFDMYIDYNNSADKWAKWWGTDWLRAGIAGYNLNGQGSGDYINQLSYLPDFRTESTTTVDIPALLKTKWTQEKTISAKTTETNNYFKSTGKQKTVRNFLVYWLSSWVEKYGIDGFRCDTAKHVENASWSALKTACVESLNKWRKNNPTAPGADWDEDFWMTGECFPHGVNYDAFYTDGKFDSMINFDYQSGQGVPGSGSINNTYGNYANSINNNDKFNVLTFISSHDCPLYNRGDAIYQGSAFQLLPGAIQIYYGDETARPNLTGNVNLGDHTMRSDMNWGSNTTTLQHWQKVGQFRSNHVAIGAGSHTNLNATSGAAFARKYTKRGVNDVVAACIGANKNQSVTITLNNTFADGTVLRNTYDNTTATVQGGKVTFNSGANGTILMEIADNSQPGTTAPATTNPQETTNPQVTTAPVTATAPNTQPATELLGIIGDANLDGKVNINDVTAIQKHIADINKLSDTAAKFADSDKNGSISIKDATYIQKYLLDMSNTAYVGEKIYSEAPTLPVVPTTSAPDPVTEPATEPEQEGTTVYFNNSENWDQVYIYYWMTGNSGPIAWPGVPMEQTEDGRWKYTVPTGYDMVVFNSNSGIQTGDLNMPASSGMTYDKASGSWS